MQKEENLKHFNVEMSVSALTLIYRGEPVLTMGKALPIQRSFFVNVICDGVFTDVTYFMSSVDKINCLELWLRRVKTDVLSGTLIEHASAEKYAASIKTYWGVLIAKLLEDNLITPTLAEEIRE